MEKNWFYCGVFYRLLSGVRDCKYFHAFFLKYNWVFIRWFRPDAHSIIDFPNAYLMEERGNISARGVCSRYPCAFCAPLSPSHTALLTWPTFTFSSFIHFSSVNNHDVMCCKMSDTFILFDLSIDFELKHALSIQYCASFVRAEIFTLSPLSLPLSFVSFSLTFHSLCITTSHNRAAFTDSTK